MTHGAMRSTPREKPNPYCRHLLKKSSASFCPYSRQKVFNAENSPLYLAERNGWAGFLVQGLEVGVYEAPGIGLATAALEEYLRQAQRSLSWKRLPGLGESQPGWSRQAVGARLHNGCDDTLGEKQSFTCRTRKGFVISTPAVATACPPCASVGCSFLRISHVWEDFGLGWWPSGQMHSS